MSDGWSGRRDQDCRDVNQVETWFSILTTKQIKRGSHHNVAQLEAAIYEFIEKHNDDPKPFQWTKTADEIRDRVAGFCSRTLEAHAAPKSEKTQGTSDPTD